MSKGIFQTPRSLGAVTDIRPIHTKVRLTDKGYRISSMIEESENVAGDLEKRLDGEVDLMESNLTPAQRAIFTNFMKLLVSLYVTQEGYSNVTVT